MRSGLTNIGPQSRRSIAMALLLLAAGALGAQYEPDLQYQQRGDRWEGLKPKPVSGYDVELLSAVISDTAGGTADKPAAAWPEALHLRFYLPADEPVFLTVRQPRPRTAYYWLDRVTPPVPWRPRAFNEFVWSTRPVLRNLTSETPADLGVVVRLRQETPSRSEAVAPAALFAAEAPTAAAGYRFTFKTNGAALVTARIYRGETVVFQRPQNREKAGSPFTLSWDPKGQPDGEYRIELSGYFDNNTPLAKEVSFHHRASWK